MLESTAVGPSNQSLREKRSFTWGAASVAGAGVLLLLGVLIARELTFRPVAAHGAGTSTREGPPASDALPLVRGAEASARASGVPVGEVAAAPAAGSRGELEAPAAAKIIAGVTEDPKAFGPSSAFAPPVAKTETFIFNALPPFNSSELKRSRANHEEWELDALRGPRIEELAPSGGVHQAATARDENGTELSTWYVIDSGPLAPAFATQSLQSLRVMSRAYVAANREEFPREVRALLGGE